jgi:hypothetical protein
MPDALDRREWSQQNLFLTGLATGVGTTLLYVCMAVAVRGEGIAMFGAGPFKLLLGVILLCLPQWRAFGAGMIASLPLAMLIAVPACFATFQLVLHP